MINMTNRSLTPAIGARVLDNVYVQSGGPRGPRLLQEQAAE